MGLRYGKVRGENPKRALLLLYPLSPDEGSCCLTVDGPDLRGCRKLPRLEQRPINPISLQHRRTAARVRMTALRDELVVEMGRGCARETRADREWRAVALSVAATVRFLAGMREPDGRIALLIEAPLGAAPTHRHARIAAEGVSLSDRRGPAQGPRSHRGHAGAGAACAMSLKSSQPISWMSSAQARDSGSRPSLIGVSRLEAWQACLRSRPAGSLKRGADRTAWANLPCCELLASEIGYRSGSGGLVRSPGRYPRLQQSRELRIEVKSGCRRRKPRCAYHAWTSLIGRGLASRSSLQRPRFQEAPDGRTVLGSRARAFVTAIDRCSAAARGGRSTIGFSGRDCLEVEPAASSGFACHSPATLYGFEVSGGLSAADRPLGAAGNC